MRSVKKNFAWMHYVNAAAARRWHGDTQRDALGWTAESCIASNQILISGTKRATRVRSTKRTPSIKEVSMKCQYLLWPKSAVWYCDWCVSGMSMLTNTFSVIPSSAASIARKLTEARTWNKSKQCQFNMYDRQPSESERLKWTLEDRRKH